MENCRDISQDGHVLKDHLLSLSPCMKLFSICVDLPQPPSAGLQLVGRSLAKMPLALSREVSSSEQS